MAIAEFLRPGTSECTRGFVMATLSYISYDTDTTRRQQRFLGVGVEEIAAIECEAGGLTGLEAYVLRHGDDIIISIRGSQEFLDFITDLDLTKMRVDGVLVHRGFARSALRLMEAFRLRRSEWLPFDRIWITGHSLGGAVGQIAGYMLHRIGEQLSSVTTFGSPRVGGIWGWKNVLTDESISDRYVRWVNHRDIVPRLPVLGLRPQNWFWKHVGTQHIIDEEERTIALADNSLLWPSRLIEGGNNHSNSGFEPGDDSGYIRGLLSFMPESELSVIKQVHAASLVATLKNCAYIAELDVADCLSHLPQIDNQPASLRLAALTYL